MSRLIQSSRAIVKSMERRGHANQSLFSTLVKDFQQQATVEREQTSQLQRILRKAFDHRSAALRKVDVLQKKLDNMTVSSHEKLQKQVQDMYNQVRQRRTTSVATQTPHIITTNHNGTS